MLKHLHIKNFTIIRETNVAFSSGLTVLTGETGAGKSILIDALQLLLGERANSTSIRNHTERCEITAIFDVGNNKAAQAWLEEQHMNEGQECLIRRTISHDSPSRSTINDRPCTLQSVRELSDLLVHIHGQNQHQHLLKTDYQRTLLDDYAQHTDLGEKVQVIYQKWYQANHALTDMESGNKTNQKEFLAFQLRELDELNLQATELEELENEHKRLSCAEQWLTKFEHAWQILTENDQSVLYGLDRVNALLNDLPNQNSAIELLEQAAIQVQEVSAQLRQTMKTLEANPDRLQWIEQRLARIHDVARKHRIMPEELLPLQQKLLLHYQTLDQSEEQIALLKQQIADLKAAYFQEALKLTESRQKTAKTFSKAITEQMKTLGMPTGCIQIRLLPREAGVLHSEGMERIEYLVSMNPGQPFAPLTKVVSGGELSRIALAIQVVAANKTVLPTLLFDEVDVGIGGRTAETVGLQLKKLGERAQVLCVTHLPQVAAQGQQHLFVEKNNEDNGIDTRIYGLSSEDRVREIARMLGGATITEKTLAHAQEMVNNTV